MIQQQQYPEQQRHKRSRRKKEKTRNEQRVTTPTAKKTRFYAWKGIDRGKMKQEKNSNDSHWMWIEVEHIDGNVREKRTANVKDIRCGCKWEGMRGSERSLSMTEREKNCSKRILVWNRRLLVDFNVRLLKCNFHILDVNDVMTSSRRNLAVVATITNEITITITAVENGINIGNSSCCVHGGKHLSLLRYYGCSLSLSSCHSLYLYLSFSFNFAIYWIWCTSLCTFSIVQLLCCQ